MPSKVVPVLFLDDLTYSGGKATYQVQYYAREYGLTPTAGLKGRAAIGSLVKQLRAKHIWGRIKLKFFRVKRFQNPRRNEVRAFVKSHKKQTYIPPPRPRRQVRWMPPGVRPMPTINNPLANGPIMLDDFEQERQW